MAATFTLVALGTPVASGTKTLSGSTAQSVAVNGAGSVAMRSKQWDVEIVNLSSAVIGFLGSGTTATSSNSIAVLPGGSVSFPTAYLAAADECLSVVGAGGETFQVNLIPRF